MKKIVFTLFAALLALSLATCDLFEPDSTGDGMVRLAINVGGANRALTLEQAQDETNGVDYYEVVFKSGTKYYEVAWDDTDGSATITIPIANYANTGNDAILFAGLKSNKTLLGVGTISTTVGGAGAGSNSNVTAATTGVTFTVTALTNGISNIAASSTFKITGPTAAAGTGYSGYNYKTDDAGIDFAPAIDTTSTGSYPVFRVPGAVSGTGYTNPNTTAGDIAASYTVTLPHSPAVILQAAWTVTAAPITIAPESPVTGPVLCPITAPAAVAIGSALPVSALPVANTCTFTFKINVSGVTADGLCGVSINVPVRAIHESDGTQTIWNIRGGSNNTAADDGSNNGGAVVLGVGNHNNFTRSILITDPSDPGAPPWN